MRIRFVELDPLVVAIAVTVALFGLLAGLGVWAVGAGLVTLGASAGSRQATAWVERRFALPPLGSAERELVARSLASSAVMKRLRQTAPVGPISDRCREMETQARAALPTIRLLALQASRVRALAAGIPLAGLEGERARIASLIAADPEERLRIELESSLRSTEAQLRTGQRLRTLTDELTARTRALTASVEAVAVGLAELQALSSSDPAAQPQVAMASLSREIEALRGGLEEAQTFGRRAAAIHLLEA